MYATFVEVNADESHIAAAREILPQFAVPRARDQGAVGGYWLSAQDGRAVSVIVFESEAEARDAASNFRVGQPPMPNAPEGVTVKTVEVREVLASL